MNFSLTTNKILIILIFVLMFFKYCQIRKEKAIEEEIIRNTQENMMPIEGLGKLKTPKKAEITSLTKSYPQVFLRYGNNNNHLNNDGRVIWQNMVRYLDNRAIICGYRYGLARIEWHKSVLTWKNQEVGLELHLVHTLVESKETVIFVIPLSLVDMRREAFVDLSYYTQKTDVSTLNSLITKCEQIPSYFCCTPNTGPMINFNLCPVANVILQQKFFYKLDMGDRTTWYITDPQPFDRYIGVDIRNKLVG